MIGNKTGMNRKKWIYDFFLSDINVFYFYACIIRKENMFQLLGPFYREKKEFVFLEANYNENDKDVYVKFDQHINVERKWQEH